MKAGRIGALVQRAVRYMENMLLNRKVKRSGSLQEKEMESAKMGTDVLEPSKDGFSGSNEWNREHVQSFG